MKLAVTPRIIKKQTAMITCAHMSPSQKIDKAVRELFLEFLKIPEIGKFNALQVDIEQPLRDSIIKKASIVIEPFADKNDFRTRVLSFIAHSPSESGKTFEYTLANGNKFSIESALKNNETKQAFRNFLKAAEKILC